jgi:hypothetical protein
MEESREFVVPSSLSVAGFAVTISILHNFPFIMTMDTMSFPRVVGGRRISS